MGRLGFNIVPKKEVATSADTKNVSVENLEKGISDQQNERNETLELSELVLLIDERNQTIKNLRLLLASLTTVIICLCAYICLTQARYIQNDHEVVEHINKMQAYTQHIQNLQGQFEAASAAKLEQAMNCSQELMLAKLSRGKMKHELDEEKAQRANENEESTEKYNALLESFEILQAEHESLGSQCLTKENELQAQLKTLQEEKAELIKKYEDASKKIQDQQQKSASQKRVSQSTPTTPAPRSRLFDPTNQLKKLNEFVKEIESVGRVVGNVFSDMF